MARGMRVAMGSMRGGGVLSRSPCLYSLTTFLRRGCSLTFFGRRLNVGTPSALCGCAVTVAVLFVVRRRGFYGTRDNRRDLSDFPPLLRLGNP